MENTSVLNLADKIFSAGWALPVLVTVESVMPLHGMLGFLGDLSEPLISLLVGPRFQEFNQIVKDPDSLKLLCNRLHSNLEQRKHE